MIRSRTTLATMAAAEMEPEEASPFSTQVVLPLPTDRSALQLQVRVAVYQDVVGFDS